MNRATRQTLLGCLGALALGGLAAWLLPHSPAGSALPASTNTPAPASGSEIEIDGPFATAYRAASGTQRWLLLVSAAEHATAGEMSTLIRIARDDYTAVHMLAQRWAELDPAGMFNSLYVDFLLPEKVAGTLPYRGILGEVLCDQWAKSDLPAAVKALTDVPRFSGRESMRARVANQALATDAEAGLKIWAAWGPSGYTRNIGKNTAWIARDPQHAIEMVLKYCPGDSVEPPLQTIGTTWGKSDPVTALQFAGTLDRQKRAILGEQIIRAWAGTDPKAAAAFAAQADIGLRNAVASRLVQTWAESDPAAALAWTQENLQGKMRVEAIGELIGNVANKNLTTASELVAGMEPGAAQNQACASIFEAWFGKEGDREAAFDWLASLPDPAARTAALQRVQWGWMMHEPEAVRDFIAGPHGDLASSQLIQQFAHNQAEKNPEAAMAWAGSLSTERAAEARRSILQVWLWSRPETAIDYTRNLPAGPERESAIRTVTQTLLRQSPTQAGEWVRSLSADEQKLAAEILNQNGPAAGRR